LRPQHRERFSPVRNVSQHDGARLFSQSVSMRGHRGGSRGWGGAPANTRRGQGLRSAVHSQNGKGPGDRDPQGLIRSFTAARPWALTQDGTD
jgi:hypothetical protein